MPPAKAFFKFSFTSVNSSSRDTRSDSFNLHSSSKFFNLSSRIIRDFLPETQRREMIFEDVIKLYTLFLNPGLRSWKVKTLHSRDLQKWVIIIHQIQVTVIWSATSMKPSSLVCFSTYNFNCYSHPPQYHSGWMKYSIIKRQ